MWFGDVNELFRRERRELEAAYPGLRLLIVPPGFCPTPGAVLPSRSAVAKGLYQLDVDGAMAPGYRICIVTAPDHPCRMPDLYLDDASVPRIADRHLYPNGLACLCVPSERREYFPPGSILVTFVRNLVHPFLVGQFYYEAHGKWPWPDRPHGTEGVLQAYRGRLGLHEEQRLVPFMRMLATGDYPKRGSPCPCGSGRRFGRCHQSAMLNLQTCIAPDDAREELALMQRCGTATGLDWHMG